MIRSSTMQKELGAPSQGSAAQFLYFNRVCFNGLYRVNLNGDFNVPIGSKTRVNLPSDNFLAVSKMLENSKIVRQDFEVTIGHANRHAFIFADPPYTVKHNTNNFVKYNENIFSWGDQERLHECLERARRRGVRVILCNADHESIRTLYRRHWTLKRVTRPSVLAASATDRAAVSELVITANC